eukprot:jgi/Chlat1/2510/Chrsp175S02374
MAASVSSFTSQAVSSESSSLKTSPFLSGQKKQLRRSAPKAASKQCAASLPVQASAGGPSAWLETAKKSAVAAAAAATLALAPVQDLALANEVDILADPVPTKGYIIDDARVVNRTSAKELNEKLASLEKETGYRVNIVTVRKLEFSADAVDFADRVLEKWYPTPELGDKKSVLLLVTTAKEGALTGGPSFNDAVGDTLSDSIGTDNIPIYSADEKYNEALISSVKRIAAKLEGQADPGAPIKNDARPASNFKTKEETTEKRGQFSSVVIGLLVISFIVPMVQYYAYVAKPKD